MFFYVLDGSISKFKQRKAMTLYSPRWLHSEYTNIHNLKQVIHHNTHSTFYFIQYLSHNCCLCMVFSLFFRCDYLFDCNVLVNVVDIPTKKIRYFWLFVCVYFLSLSQMHGSVNVKIKTNIQAIWLLRTKKLNTIFFRKNCDEQWQITKKWFLKSDRLLALTE